MASLATKDDIDKLSLQIGVLMAAVGALVEAVGSNNPPFALKVRGMVQHVSDLMLAQGVSEASLELAQGTINSILAGLPPS